MDLINWGNVGGIICLILSVCTIFVIGIAITEKTGGKKTAFVVMMMSITNFVIFVVTATPSWIEYNYWAFFIKGIYSPSNIQKGGIVILLIGCILIWTVAVCVAAHKKGGFGKLKSFWEFGISWGIVSTIILLILVGAATYSITYNQFGDMMKAIGMGFGIGFTCGTVMGILIGFLGEFID